MTNFDKHKHKAVGVTASLVASLFLLGSCGDRAADGKAGQTQEATPSSAAAETTTTPPPTSLSLSARVAGKDMKEEDYADLSNDALSWWYRIPDPLGQGAPAGIDGPVANLLDQYDGMWQVPAGKKKVYLTMDAGYELENSAPTLLAVAKEKNFKINFFLTKGYVDSNPDLVKQMKAGGHVISNHSNMHLNGAQVLDESGLPGMLDEIEPMNESLRAVIGEDAAPFFRPPQGGYSERSLAIIRDLGYHPVFWSFAYRDWIADEQMPEDEAIEKVMEQLHDGSIMLLHANSQTNVNIMSRLVDRIREQGYEFGTLYEAYDAIQEAKANPQAAEPAAVAQPAKTTQKPAPPDSVAYEVKEGDTLWHIVSEHFPGASVTEKLKEVAALNGVDDPDKMPVRVGDTIYLPKQ